MNWLKATAAKIQAIYNGVLGIIYKSWGTDQKKVENKRKKKKRDESETLQSNIGNVFKSEDLLKEALTHRSYVNENANWPFRNNERLEFLGDTVLEFVLPRIF